MKNIITKIQEQNPKFNPDICDGMAYINSRETLDFINSYWEETAKSYPKSLKYMGYKKCNPDEQFTELTRLSGVKRANKFDLVKSDIIATRFNFEVEGVPISKVLFIPFLRRGSMITLWNTTYYVGPVLTDNLFGIKGKGSESEIHIQFTKNRIKFFSQITSFNANGAPTFVPATWSRMWFADKNEINNVAYPTLITYLLCKYGITETFKRFYKTDVVIGGSEITEEKYPKEDWVIISSNGNAISQKRATAKNPLSMSQIRLAIPKKQFEGNKALASAIGGMFYALDYCSAYGFISEDFVNEPRLWCRILVRLIWRPELDENSRLEKLARHFVSVESFMDAMFKQKVRREGIMAKDTDEFLLYLINNYVDVVAKTDNLDMTKKYLTTLPYLLYDLTEEIVKFMYRVIEESKNKQLTAANVTTILNSINSDLVVSRLSGHGEVMAVESANDSMLAKTTLRMVSQENASTSKAGKSEVKATDPEVLCHESIPIVCSFSAIGGSNVDARNVANPYCRTKPDGKIYVEDHIKPKQKRLAEMLSREERR